jgi:hypothetical protein
MMAPQLVSQAVLLRPDSRADGRTIAFVFEDRAERTILTVIVLAVWAVDVRRDRLVIGLAAG